FDRLLRYIYKGSDRSSFAITEVADDTIDTIKQWKSLRCLTATEAAWRCTINEMHFRQPAAEGIYLHDRRTSAQTRMDGSTPKPTLLERYFHRPTDPNFDAVDIVQYHSQFGASKSPPRYADGRCWSEAPWDDDSNQLQVYRRRPTPTTTKIFFLGAPRVAQGDTFYLWLLLKNGSTPRSFDDALSVSGVEYPTFKEAASAAGFLDDPLLNEAAFALEEAVQSYTTPKQLRRLFVLLVRSDFPVATAFDKFYPHMIEERWKEQHSNVFAQKVELLQDLQRRLVAEGCKHLSHLGIDVPDGFDLTDSHLQRERTKQFFNQKEADIDTVRDALRIFTAEQRQIFDKVLDACRCGRDALFDIRGRAGSGKTVLLNAIGAQSRLDGHLTAPTASTGFAALNQTFGLTFHRTFDV
ncbi:unnamed protein product, partial [Ectocarpus fasciculatus]